MKTEPSTGDKTPDESGSKDQKPGAGDSSGGGDKDPPKDGDKDTPPDGDPDGNNWDDKTKSYIKKLRKENAGFRTKVNQFETQLTDLKTGLSRLAGGEEDTGTPEEQISNLEEGMGQAAFQNGILNLAIEHSIGKEHLDYFSFLMAGAVGDLEEGEELDDEAIGEVVKKVQKLGGNSSAPSKTSVTEGDDGGKPPASTGEVSLDQFCNMSIGEKTKLYHEKPELYNSLYEEAKKARRLI